MSTLVFPAPTWPTLPVEGGGCIPVGRIFCVGQNYEAHAAEMGTQVDREAPFWFTKSPRAVVLRVNGEVRQQADLAELAWKVPELVAHLSTLYHLQPGDVIMTGTPSGAVWPSDRLEGEVEGVGRVVLTILPAEG
jgi:2-keto-4-pentenoate hydratase/2-oxohepta-3-ene-1,7-dioic acid hydratase in catechol pathway